MTLPAASVWTIGEARNGPVGIRYLEAGRGPLVILLHGFPDSPHSWRFQRDAIVGAGFRVVTPWLRGYGPSDKPPGVSAYHVEVLASDVAALIGSLGEMHAAAVAGHDWGGVIAWRLAAVRPDLLERLIILNAPHPAAFARELRTVDQLVRSLYVGFFQLPWLPELVLQVRGMALVRRAITRMVRRHEAFTEADWRVTRESLAERGALRAALSYYRAAGRAMMRGRGSPAQRIPHIEVPTLLLWGEQDEALSVRLSERIERWVSRLTVRRFPRAGHWVHWDEPEAIGREMIEFLARR